MSNFYFSRSLYGLSEDIAQRVLEGAIKKKVLTAKTIRVKAQLKCNIDLLCCPLRNALPFALTDELLPPMFSTMG